MPGRLESINVSRGGVPKTPVFEALITERGLDGDSQRDTRFHGGPDRAVVLYSLDVIEALQREGHPISPGTTGENLTISGVTWTDVRPGAEVHVGPVRLRITDYAEPCRIIRESFLASDFNRILQDRYRGFSRVCA